MSVGAIGTIRKLPHPSSDAVTAALNLLSVFGSDNKALKATLEEMRTIQIENERILNDASKAVNELSKLRSELDQEKGKFAVDQMNAKSLFDKRAGELLDKERQMDIELSNHKTRISEEARRLKEDREKLDKALKEVEMREKESERKRKIAEELSESALARHQELDERQKELDRRYAKLRDAID